MKVIDDGVIKYDRSNFSHSEDLGPKEYLELEYWRKKLYKLELIGEYKEVNIGFGNLSLKKDYSRFLRSSQAQFIITGTQTGKYPDLNGAHYTRVLDYSIPLQKIHVMGPIEASSEALTHASIYSSNEKINCVFHIHSPYMWSKMIKDNSDFTAADVPYGTLEMANATRECIAEKNSGVFCMKGHEDGIVIYGQGLEEVGLMTLDLYKRYFS